jgi:hypothetical protein
LFEEILGRAGYVNYYSDLITRTANTLKLIFSCIGKKWYSHQSTNRRFGITSTLCWDYQSFVAELNHYIKNLQKNSSDKQFPSKFDSERYPANEEKGWFGTDKVKYPENVDEEPSSVDGLAFQKFSWWGGTKKVFSSIGSFLGGAAKSVLPGIWGYHSNPGQIWTYCDPELRQKVLDIGELDDVKISLYRHPRATGLFYGVDKPDKKITKRKHKLQDGDFNTVNLLDYPVRVRRLIREFGPRYE